ncbi:hypothetical protein [Frondihabitans cladoniiphilus]|uniref:Uncharacterized protein n=1 Tax=Frondihabitans cladoniiphilus TaxID=715785 RepID=A0ABP8W9A4_9MICO
MENRFRIDGVENGVDRRRSVASLDGDGVLDATVVAESIPESAAEWATVPPRLLITRIPVRFDGEAFGARVDQDLVDELSFQDDEDDGRVGDAGVVFLFGSRFEVFGRVTLQAGDRLRFRGDVHPPGSLEPWVLDVSLGFGGRRGPRI